MWCKMEFFGTAIEEAMNENVYGTSSKHGPQNLLTLLPDEFTLDDVIRARQMAGLDVKGTKQMLYQWVYRHYLTVLTDNSYKKLKFRSDGIDFKPDCKR